MSIDPKIFEIAISPHGHDWCAPAPAPSEPPLAQRAGRPDCERAAGAEMRAAQSRNGGSARVCDHILLQLLRDCPEGFDESGDERRRQVIFFCQDAKFPSGVWQGQRLRRKPPPAHLLFYLKIGEDCDPVTVAQ